ncbi:MAG: hypothetical protein QF415_09045 [Candidatus Undinarchaeales archaeon]|nr:hypothetical protein [Candidatus Undinarchaeales archaeon]MDP7493241.1 hypothetical protein [Candidatus Undinarchaeales archaeon]
MRDSPVITLLLLFLILFTPVSAACVLGPGNTIQLVDSNPVTCDYDTGPPFSCAGCTLDAVLNEWDCVINEGDGTCTCSPPVATDCGFAESCKRDSGTGSAYCEEACLDTGAVQQRRCDVMDKLAGGSGCIETEVPYYTGPVTAAVACSGGDEDKRLCFYCDLTGKLMADTCLISDVTGRAFLAVGELQKDCNPNENPCQVDAENNIVYCDKCLVDEGVVAQQVRCNGNLHKCQQSTDSCYSGNAPLEAACDAENLDDIDCKFCESDGSIVTSGCSRVDGLAECDESNEEDDCLPVLADGERTFQCGSQEGGTVQCSRCINDVDNARFAIGETRRCVMPAVYGDLLDPITCDPLPTEDVLPIQCYYVESGDPLTLGPPPGAPPIEDACIEPDGDDPNPDGITCKYCSTSGVARDARCDVDMGNGAVVCSDEPLPPPGEIEVTEECLEDAQWHYACNDPDNDPDDLDDCRVMLDAADTDTFSKNCDRCHVDAEGNSQWRVQRCNYDAGAHTATCERYDVGCKDFSRCSWNSTLDAYTDPDHLRLLQFTCADPDPRCIVAEDEEAEWDRETCESAPYNGQWDAGFLHCVVPLIVTEDTCTGFAYGVEWFGDPLPMCLPDPALTQNLEDVFGVGWNADSDYRDHYCMGGQWYSCVHPQEFEDVTLQTLANAGGDILNSTYRAQKESYYANLKATLIAEEIDAGLPGEDGQCCAPESLESLDVVTRTILGTDEDELPRVYTCLEMDIPYVIRAPYSDEMNALAPDPMNDPWAPDAIDDSPFQQELAERWGDEGNRTHLCEGSGMCIDLDLGMCCPDMETDHCKFCRVFSLTDDLDDPNANCVATDCFDPDCPGDTCEFTQCQDLDDLADNCEQGCTHALFLPAADCDEAAICAAHLVQPAPLPCCNSDVDCCEWLADQYATAINDGSFPTPYYCLNPEEPDPVGGVHTHWCALGKRAGSECDDVKECATFATLPGHGDCEENVCLGRDLDVFFDDLITYPAPDEDDQCEITENLAQCGLDQDNYLLRALYPPMTPAELECSYEGEENSFAPLADLAISMRENMVQYCTVREPISTSLCNNFFNSIGFTSCLVPVDPVPTLEELDSALIVPLPEEEGEEEE